MTHLTLLAQSDQQQNTAHNLSTRLDTILFKLFFVIEKGILNHRWLLLTDKVIFNNYSYLHSRHPYPFHQFLSLQHKELSLLIQTDKGYKLIKSFQFIVKLWYYRLDVQAHMRAVQKVQSRFCHFKQVYIYILYTEIFVLKFQI